MCKPGAAGLLILAFSGFPAVEDEALQGRNEAAPAETPPASRDAKPAMGTASRTLDLPPYAWETDEPPAGLPPHESESGAPPGAEPRTAKERFLEAHGEFAEKARRFIPMFELSALYMPEGKIHKEKGEFELEYYKLDALAPIPLGRDTFLLVGAHGGARDYDFDDVEGADDEILYNAGLRLGAGHFFSDDLVGQAYWQPSLYSDLDGTLNSRDWRLWYGAMLVTYRLQPDLFVKGGVLLTDAADTGAFPLVGLSWIFHPGWRLDILVPRNLEVSWGPTRAFNIHAGLEIEPDEFHIRYRAPGGEAETDVHVQDIRAYVGAYYRFTDHFSILAKCGSTVAGHYEWRDGSGSKYDGTLAPALFVQAGFGLTF